MFLDQHRICIAMVATTPIGFKLIRIAEAGLGGRNVVRTSHGSFTGKGERSGDCARHLLGSAGCYPAYGLFRLLYPAIPCARMMHLQFIPNFLCCGHHFYTPPKYFGIPVLVRYVVSSALTIATNRG